MRTTIELTDSQRSALTRVADRRGLRGYSVLVQEAVDSYLAALDASETRALIDLGGSLTDEEADRMEQRIADLRGSWRAAS